MKASIKSKYDGGASGHSATTTLSFGVGDLKLKASCRDCTFGGGKSSGGSGGGAAAAPLAGVSLGVEKPGAFMIDYELESGGARFQFMNSAKVCGKQVKVTYIHPQKRNATLLEASLAVDPRNKLTAKYSFASGKGQIKYSYTHAASNLTLEPSYDLGTESWNLAMTKKLSGQQNVKATYEPRCKALGLEWTSDDKASGQFKVAASFNLDSLNKPPKLLLEKTWNYEL